MAVIQAGACGREEGFNEFRFSELAQESQGVSSDVFVGVLKIVTDTVTAQKDRLLDRTAYNVGMRHVSLPDQDHLLLQLAIRVEFRTDLIVEI